MNIKFPDGSSKQFEAGVTPLQIAEGISQRLAKDVLAATVNGEEWDLTRPIVNDAEIKLFKWDDPEENMRFGIHRHTCLPRLCRSCIQALNSVSVRRLRTDSIMI